MKRNGRETSYHIICVEYPWYNIRVSYNTFYKYLDKIWHQPQDYVAQLHRNLSPFCDRTYLHVPFNILSDRQKNKILTSTSHLSVIDDLPF